jgi:hypothetical protein
MKVGPDGPKERMVVDGDEQIWVPAMQLYVQRNGRTDDPGAFK